MKPYIDFNTKLRQGACNDFEKDLFELMNNACFGETMENVKLRKNIELVSNARKFLKLIAKPQLKSFKILNENTVLVNRVKETVLLDKPIYAGFCLLEWSKVLMYEFHYDVIVNMYGDNSRSLFTDTDSLCYHFQTDDVYLDMLALRDSWLGTSAFPKDHVLYSETNKKSTWLHNIWGKWGCIYKVHWIARESIFPGKLWPSSLEDDSERCQNNSINQHVKHDIFLKTLLDRKCTYAQFINIRSRSHKIESVAFHRVCLSAYDDKRHVIDDGVSSLAYGHISLRRPDV